MPLIAAALTFGSFGDILEAAKIAKRIMDVLRKGGGSRERQRLITTLQHICEDMSWLTVLPEDRFTTRLCDEIALCRSLLDQFHAKIKAYESFVGRIWMVASEEKELASWRYQISERRAALRDLLGPISILQLYDIGEQLGRVGSQVQYVGSRIDNVDTEVRTLGVLIENYLSNGISHMESEIRGVAADVQTVQQAIHKILPRNISDPFFYVRNPLGERIPIPLSAYHIFDDLDRILRAYCHRPETGSRYVERGDYSIVSPDGAIIPRSRLRREVKAGIEFDMSIIQRKRWRPAPEKCHHCGHTNADAAEGTWVNCLNCEARYQVSRWIEEISSPQIFRQDGAEPFREDDQGESEDGQEESEDHKEESFPLVQIFYQQSKISFSKISKLLDRLSQATNDAEQLSRSAAHLNPEDPIDSPIHFGPQIYGVSDPEVTPDGDDNSAQREV